MIISEYATRFQTLPRFAPELVTTDDKKCRRFEKGLHPSIRKYVVGQRIGMFSDIVECARSIEYTEEIPEETKVQKLRRQTISKSISIETSGSQGRKRQRDQFWSTSGQHSSKPPNLSRMSGVSSGSMIMCYRCRQSAHRAVDCPQKKEYHGQRPPRALCESVVYRALCEPVLCWVMCEPVLCWVLCEPVVALGTMYCVNPLTCGRIRYYTISINGAVSL
ncbi:uncharacterized protein LOC131332905 [Rhododendron vialii]|uniref:uncharacterized protein LOC131332905 n=1 Tax=Rhododendron vialii TaxID=182163 RepID=UPI00265EE65E|nr:uncharacterized protein LOC131332905 [Rhododendron vialii]